MPPTTGRRRSPVSPTGSTPPTQRAFGHSSGTTRDPLRRPAAARRAGRCPPRGPRTRSIDSPCRTRERRDPRRHRGHGGPDGLGARAQRPVACRCTKLAVELVDAPTPRSAGRERADRRSPRSALALVELIRVVTVLRRHRQFRCAHGCDVENSPRCLRPRCPAQPATLRSREGSSRPLTNAEFAIVIAHEQSHARHRHDRFLLLALVVDAAVPFMRRATAQLRFHLERWADEDAVQFTATDRSTVARNDREGRTGEPTSEPQRPSASPRTEWPSAHRAH